MPFSVHRTALYALALVFAGACSLGSPRSIDEQADAAPIRVKTPSNSDKSGTVEDCDGITEHGVCQDGAAVVCDVAAGELRRTDCEALGQRCVVDSSAGATCQAASDVTCDSGLDYEGYCDGEVARWCDANGDNAWNCADDGMTCQVDVCEDGAFCCGESDGGDTECDTLGYRGECGGEHGQTARYCNEGEVVELHCDSEETHSCQVDACAEGAYCCPGDLECDDLGFEGECAGNTVRYCNEGGEYNEFDCTELGMVCGTECAEGSDCCDLTCEDVGTGGTCLGDWLVFCEGGELRKVNCPEEEPDAPNCDPEGEFGFAQCSE